MTHLRYYTSDALENLRSTVADHLDWYHAPVRELPSNSLGGFRESKVEASAFADRLVIDDKRPSSTDAENALIVYDALKYLTPHQASIERMWAYLCHFDCQQYVAARWLNRRPDNEKDAVREIRNHFFAVGNRALIRDNGVSRLWWLGKISHDVAPDDPREFLTVLLHRQDVRSALIERPSVSMNRELLRGIYAVMREHWVNGGALFERDAFRNWMVALNRRGGVVLLDALPNDALSQLLREEADKAVSTFEAK